MPSSKNPSAPTLTFTRGRRLYQIAPAYTGEGYVGFCDGRMVVMASDRAQVARALVMQP
jgi:hypothetical protein